MRWSLILSLYSNSCTRVKILTLHIVVCLLINESCWHIFSLYILNSFFKNIISLIRLFCFRSAGRQRRTTGSARRRESVFSGHRFSGCWLRTSRPTWRIHEDQRLPWLDHSKCAMSPSNLPHPAWPVSKLDVARSLGGKRSAGKKLLSLKLMWYTFEWILLLFLSTWTILSIQLLLWLSTSADKIFYPLFF
jgi:hypothetical protein